MTIPFPQRTLWFGPGSTTLRVDAEALPLTNTARVAGFESETNTTVLTYLFMNPRSSFASQQGAAARYVAEHLERPEDHVVGVAGTVPARLVGLSFRSLVAPVLALGCAWVLVACVALLVLASLPLLSLRLDVGFTASLPRDNPVSRASAAASAGFSPGINSPTTLLLEGRDVTSRLDQLAALQARVASQPAVAGVLGPAQNIAQRELDIVLAKGGDAARMLVVFDHDPLGATAIGDLAAIAVNLLLLVVFLRALVAPLYLLASNILTLAAMLGLTVWLFQGILGEEGLTLYVPFAAAVLLVALGSESARAITAAGVTLALSFGMLAVIPLRPFRELAFAMSLGILVDVPLVRSILMPLPLPAHRGGGSQWLARPAPEEGDHRRARRVVGSRP